MQNSLGQKERIKFNDAIILLELVSFSTPIFPKQMLMNLDLNKLEMQYSHIFSFRYNQLNVKYMFLLYNYAFKGLHFGSFRQESIFIYLFLFFTNLHFFSFSFLLIKKVVLRKKIYLGSPRCKIHTAAKSQSLQNSVFAVHHVLENVWLVNGRNGQSVVL